MGYSNRLYLDLFITLNKSSQAKYKKSPATLDEVLSSSECHWLCISAGRRQNVFAGSLTLWQKVSQGYPKKDSHKAEGKMPIPKQFQNRNWQAEVRMVCNGEHCLHWLMIEVRKVCNGEHCLHWWKLFCLWIYNVQLYFKNNFPFQKSCLWSMLDGKLERKTWEMFQSIKWNVCCGIPYGHLSAPVLHCLLYTSPSPRD